MGANDSKWYKLDNAATIVPATTRGSDTRVFRVACELKETVERDYLQEALDETMEEFPHFRVVLRKGFFWYYLDSTAQRPVVNEEKLPPCSPLYFSGRKNLLFRVSYFEKRINVEMFHAIADGTGGFLFTKKLVLNYLKLRHGIRIPENPDNMSSADEKKTDAFDFFYSGDKSQDQLKTMMARKAYRIRQEKDDNMYNHL